MAPLVAEGGQVHGADISEQMLKLARAAGVDARLVIGTSLPFGDGQFDAAVATQVYEFVEDLAGALGELYRVLRPGGRVVILDTDWDSIVWHSRDPERMRRVLDGWRARTANPYLPRTLARELQNAGFEVTGCEALAILDRRGEEGSYSARQIDHLGASASGVSEADIAEWAADLRALARSGDYFFSLNRYLFLARKPASE
jgi:SAM-dependent methyltransferase